MWVAGDVEGGKNAGYLIMEKYLREHEQTRGVIRREGKQVIYGPLNMKRCNKRRQREELEKRVEKWISGGNALLSRGG